MADCDRTQPNVAERAARARFFPYFVAFAFIRASCSSLDTLPFVVLPLRSSLYRRHLLYPLPRPSRTHSTSKIRRKKKVIYRGRVLRKTEQPIRVLRVRSAATLANWRRKCSPIRCNFSRFTLYGEFRRSFALVGEFIFSIQFLFFRKFAFSNFQIENV